MLKQKQSFITSFFDKEHVRSDDRNISRELKMEWEPLFYDRERVDIILSNLDKVKKDCEESYKRNKKVVSRGKINKVFEILKHDDAKRLMGLFRRDVPVNRKYYKRLVHEFHLIVEKKFCEVFIQVKEILSMTTEFPHIIRGSAGCSLVCYLMEITHMDPIELNISLTRFMHEKREDLPDIDMDFPAHRRNEIYERIFKRYKGRVARISNHVMFKQKSAIKEAIRKEGYHKFIPKDFELDDIFKNTKQINRVLSVASELEGTSRCYSLHCGGIVIFNEKVPEEYFLKDYQIYKGKDKFKNTVNGRQIHLNKDEVDEKMLIKIDILSNNGLSQCIEINPQLKIDSFTFDDEKVYNFLTEGNNLGITYAESRGMNKIFTLMKPKTLEDIAIALALIRPAAAKNGQKFNFLKNFHGTIECDQRDYIIYDDDAIEFIAKTLRITLSEADQYRKAFAKQRWYLKKEFREKLVRSKPEWSAEKIELIYSQLECLQEYSFCKSHAYSYAMLVYILCYYKIYQPIKFWKATLKHCNTSYRKWTHYRGAKKVGVVLEPYLKKYKNTLNLLDTGSRDIAQYFQDGFWTSNKYLPGMYLRVENHPDKKDVKRAYFRGLIATSKLFLSDKKIKDREGDPQKRKNTFVTFITLGIDDNKWIDIVAWGPRKLAKVHCLEGYGYWEDDSWIRVENMSASRLTEM